MDTLDNNGINGAVVTYLGYDAPDTVLEGTKSDYAIDGAERFRDFLGSLPDNASVDLYGHSYGSLLSGHALFAGADVDRFHMLGSPGIGRDSVQELVDRGIVVTSSMNPNDPIRFTPDFVHGEVPPENAISIVGDGDGHSEYFDAEDLFNLLRIESSPPQ